MNRPYTIPDAGRIELLEGFFQSVRAGNLDAVAEAARADATLVHAYDPNPWCCRGTPLNVAVSRGDRALAALLLDLGADPNQKSAWWAGGFAPLHSVSPEHTEVVELLVARGAVVDVHAAAALDREDELVALLDHDPHLVNASGGDGGRPLHFAASSDVADVLVGRGALIDPLDVDHGSTPAQWAVRDRPDVTRTLLQHGARADVFMLSALGDQALLEQWIQNHPEDVSVTLSPLDFPAPGSPAGHTYVYALTGYDSQPLHVAAKFGHVEALDSLVRAGADVSCRGGYDEQTPLHTAASSNRPRVVRRLVELGADPDAVSGEEHETPPIVWAIVFGAVRGVEAMISAGAAITDSVIQAAESGVEGKFDEYSSAERQDFVTIRQAVTAAA